MDAMPAMRSMVEEAEGEERWVRVGRMQEDVCRGSRQAPPWM
jgi:hypothetical protein